MTDRELDALVAEKVMGECLWSVFRREGDCLRDGWPDAKGHDLRYSFQTKEQAYEFLEQRGGRDAGAVMKPQPEPYSTTGDGMLAVIEAMREKGWIVEMSGPDLLPRCWAEFYQLEGKMLSGGDGDADTLPRAVCLAALKAIGVEVPA